MGGSATDHLEALIPIIAITGGVIVALVAIITSAITKASQTKAREESRREIAAYVAEGTISPDDAAKILSAGTVASQIEALRNKVRA